MPFCSAFAVPFCFCGKPPEERNMEQLEPKPAAAPQPRPLRRLRAGLVAAAALLVCLGGGWLLWREVGPAEYRQVRAGMTLPEVVAILGPPKDRGEKFGTRPGAPVYTVHEWDNPHGVIFVVFAWADTPFKPMTVFRTSF